MGGKLSIAFSALAIMMGAVLSTGAAPTFAQGNPSQVRAGVVSPQPARFRVENGRGLLVKTWINGSGPYIFAIDTGAGSNLIAERVAHEARLAVNTTPTTIVGGLTGGRTSTNRAAVINQIALGDRNNVLPSSKQTALIVSLPPALDGILDPTEAFAPYGYSIDIPNELIQVFQGNLQGRQPPPGGAIVPWVRRSDGNRPFVRLRDNRIALLDTGSGFGLAVSERDAVIIGSNHPRSGAVSTRDIGGGSISSRRVAPTTVSIGELELRGVPTDILFGVERDAPVILGRDALRPFKITFDPRRRLIEFDPAVNR
ncbi:MAG: aspartyl protease family protein [Pyrinomonadaceae bacterium]|nr:aspartyl protease family protein [Pyrinomonadaceae bacterium]